MEAPEIAPITLAESERLFPRSQLRDNKGAMRDIEIRGARVHNLKNVSCRIPHRKLTVITGPSGSGKSSLAFDTLFAEGQRRYIESMSSYARQFLARIEKPDVEQIDHILPAIALEQKNPVRNARSTVGTATDIYDYLRVLFAAVGKTYCDHCGGRVQKATPSTVLRVLEAFPDKTKLLLVAPMPIEGALLTELREQGYFRYVDAADKVVEIPTSAASVDDLPEDVTETGVLPLLVDRLVLKANRSSGDTTRLLESLGNAFRLSGGLVELRILGEATETLTFSNKFACQQCGKSGFTEPFPEMFAFNHARGACPTCEGFGRVMGLDMDKVIPNKRLSLREGAIHPFQTPANKELQELLEQEAPGHRVRLDVPYSKLSELERQFVLMGNGEYPGVRPFFEWLDTKRYKVHVRVTIARYRGYYECPVCQGARLKPEALNVKLETAHGDYTIGDVTRIPVKELLPLLLTHLKLSETEREVSQRILEDLNSRLQYLVDVGLGYLTLARNSRTLSGGESQRIHLASALGSGLTNTLYVLDEPTVGLHARDTDRLIGILKALRDKGNTLAIVEHDPEMILAADHVLDIGPESGERGGHIIFEGDVPGLLQTPYSLTARYLNPELVAPSQNSAPPEESSSRKASGYIEILGARGNNLKNLSVKIPCGKLVCVTGVSGSGKSTLIKQTLYQGALQAQGELLTEEPAPCDALSGLERFKGMVLVDQSPLARSARSNPVTYVKAYDEIRALFASSNKAKALGIKPSDFSFNTPGGRCETCEGLGTVTVDMQFMADVTMTCPDCDGKRFTPSVLSIDLFSRNIHDVLNMTIEEAIQFFRTAPKVTKKLKPLQEIGLGYLRLGQSTSTLSGGEAQRLKLASYLKNDADDWDGEYCFLFDEPTTGLHLSDIDTLVAVLKKLVVAGHTVIVIEHNLDFVAHADWILDLGPEGGDEGGEVVAEGTLETVLKSKNSHTATFLAKKLVPQALAKTV
jgi:excinuclease ABC subunit A